MYSINTPSRQCADLLMLRVMEIVREIGQLREFTLLFTIYFLIPYHFNSIPHSDTHPI
jgi:hypothetical protein